MENYTYGVLNSLRNVADIIDDKNDDEQNVAVGNDRVLMNSKFLTNKVVTITGMKNKFLTYKA